MRLSPARNLVSSALSYATPQPMSREYLVRPYASLFWGSLGIDRRAFRIFSNVDFRNRSPCSAAPFCHSRPPPWPKFFSPPQSIMLEVRIGDESRGLIRAVLKHLRVEHADVLPLFPSAVRLFSDVSRLFGRDDGTALEQALGLL